MRISPNWLREFVELKVDDRRLAADLTMAGTAVESISGESDDLTFLMEITTNRVDAMNHYGVARECSAIYDTELKPLQARLPAAKGKAGFAVELRDPDLCGRYTARVLRGVSIGPSPAQLVKRLERMEARSINNAADATNYNLIEMGHPTHAFDLDTLRGGKIIVRRARAGEKLVTLDEAERTLAADDLVIADAERAVALAGIMGGLETMITARTRNVLIESAWFDPIAIRRTARRLGMHTDASHRFERGADWSATPLACARVAQLILEAGGGELVGEEIDAIGRRVERAPIALRHGEVRRIVGEDITDQEIVRVLSRLGFALTPQRSSSVGLPGNPHTAGAGGVRTAIAEQVDAYQVTPPTWRLDVEAEIDLIEEVARIHGYENFPNTLPSFSGGVVEPPQAEQQARVRTTLLALGYHEAVSLTFIARADAERFSSDAPVELANPLSEEAAFMRNSLVPGMLDMLARNLNRGIADVRLFETGHVFALVGSGTEERPAACIGATGAAFASGLHAAARLYSFFDLKGDVETLLESFQHQALYFDAHTPDYYHPGRSARAVMDGTTVAQFGQLHPEAAAARKLRQEVFLAEIHLDRLFQRPLRQVRYQPLSRYPAVERDFSFLFGESTSFEQIRSAVAALRIAELRSFQPVEIFRGGAVPAGKYSLLSRAVFQSAERTLRDDEVAGWAAQIIKSLEALGGTLRA